MKNAVPMLMKVPCDFSLGMLPLRALAAFAMIRAHGLPKLLNFEGTMEHIPDPFGFGPTFAGYYAISVNVFCALLVGLGLFTRVSAVLVLTVTLSGLFLVHWSDPAKIQDVPILYSILFGFIAYMGPGKYSLDFVLTKS